jgi:Ser/Thr protein kinase RdoA (MazF antagonist)
VPPHFQPIDANARTAGPSGVIIPSEPVAVEVRRRQLGGHAAIGELHAALATYPGDLPPLVGPLTDIATARSLSDDEVLHRAAEQLVPLALKWPRRPLHGDAHTGNVLLTPGGSRWTDFEDVCVGPTEWDLASLTVPEEALAAYPGELDLARLAECRDLRRLQIFAQLLVGDFDEPALEKAVRTRLHQRLRRG